MQYRQVDSKAGVQYRQLSIGPNAQHKNQVYKQLGICTADPLGAARCGAVVGGGGPKIVSMLSTLYLDGVPKKFKAIQFVSGRKKRVPAIRVARCEGHILHTPNAHGTTQNVNIL